MNINQFQKEAVRTDIEDYSPIQKRLLENKDTLQKAIMGFMVSSSTLDMMKKKVMYNADHLKLLKLDAELFQQLRDFPTDFIDEIAKCPLRSQLLHYTIGVITEANEMVVALAKASKGELDIVNMAEEIGDVNWYNSLICERLGVNMGEVLARNNAKLKARYPEKFTSDNATNRDLEKERKILEGDINA
jgi:NTP pyrophosphatase (non-canonical NTP hydrolase)